MIGWFDLSQPAFPPFESQESKESLCCFQTQEDEKGLEMVRVHQLQKAE